jgi:Tc5 transposase DNA-binding domain/DDE superfamily endonuclease
VPLSGPIIQQKAKLFAAKLGIEHFEASNGWLTNFNSRNGISQKTVDTVVAEDWIENVLPGLNMTSVLQPMDLGIIKNLKQYYRHDLVLKQLDQMENKQPLADVNIL